MRLLRHKRNRKTLEFYRLSFQIFPPYKVLVDGNFIAQAAKMQLQASFERLVQQLLADTTFLHVTDCVLAELAALGEPGRLALEAAHSISVIRCRHKHGHKPGMDPAECFASLVGPANTTHYVVATQDAELRRRLRAVPGTPLLLFSQNVLVLEPASGASKGEHSAAERGKASLSAAEAAAVRAAKKALREGVGTEHGLLLLAPLAAVRPPAAASPATAAAGSGGAGLGAGAAAGVKRRRKSSGGPSGPNPLSVKKKKQRPALPVPAPSATAAAAARGVAPAAAAGPSGGEGEGAAGVAARRRRKKSHGGGAAALAV